MSHSTRSLFLNLEPLCLALSLTQAVLAGQLGVELPVEADPAKGRGKGGRAARGRSGGRGR